MDGLLSAPLDCILLLALDIAFLRDLHQQCQDSSLCYSLKKYKTVFRNKSCGSAKWEPHDLFQYDLFVVLFPALQQKTVQQFVSGKESFHIVFPRIVDTDASLLDVPPGVRIVRAQL